MLGIKALMVEINSISNSKGWDCVVENDPGKFSEKMLLIISEIIEAVEAFRNNELLNSVRFDEETGKPEGIPIEIADAVIRIFHFCEANDIDLEAALQLKINYNKTRPFRHGGKAM